MKKKHLSYKEAIQYLYGLQKYGIKFGLSKRANLLKAFGNPHQGRRYIHIAGSNGKGSVAAMLEAILMNSGLTVGLYSSPHLVRFTERCRINGKEITPEGVARITGELIRAINPKHPPTFFEVTTALALIYFSMQDVDIAIMEVGMGGRLDATNVISPLVSAITNISLEHREFLGSHLLDIAREKAGIIKRGVDLVTGVTQASVIELLRSHCEERGAPYWRVGKDIRYRPYGTKLAYYGLDRRLRGIELGLQGNFQNRNAALALGIVELLERKGFALSSSDMTKGLKKTRWPGRMHILSRSPTIILDGAHNPGAIRALAGSVRHRFGNKRLILVLGVMGDKDILSVIRGIVPLADHVIYTRPDYYRSADPEEMMRTAASLGKPGEVVRVIAKAIERAREMARPEDVVLVSGSLFTVGEALTCLDPEKFRPDDV